MPRNIHNVMTDIADELKYKESDLPWTFQVDQDVGLLELRFNANILPAAIRRPVMVCRIKIARMEDDGFQSVFLEKNTLFQPDAMLDVMRILLKSPIDLN